MRRLIFAMVLCFSTTVLAQKFEGLAPTPPMGWNSWNTFEVNINEWAVCFFNSGDQAMTIRVIWGHLWFLKGTYQIRDLWQKKDLGKTDKQFIREIPSHDVVLLRLSPVK